MDELKVANWLKTDQTSRNDMITNRREKRSIPDSEKDEKYWDKRQRNNMAAKRSRENKRLIEMTTKQQAGVLERENLLLKHEIKVLKKRFGLPINKSFLSKEELEAIERDWQKNRSVRVQQELRTANSDDDNKDPHPVSLVRNQNISEYHEKHNIKSRSDTENSDSSRSSFPDESNTHLPYYAMLLAASLPKCSENGIQGANAPGHLLTQPPFQYYMPYGVAPPTSQAHFPIKTEQLDHSLPHSNVEENQEIKMKLMKLSAQVDEMKSKFIKNQ